MHFYHYTRQQVLAEPVLAFWGLYYAIEPLQAAADLRALRVAGAGANPGEKGEHYRDVADELSERAGYRVEHHAPANQRVVPGLTPGVGVAEAGEIAELRRRQMENARKREAEWRAEQQRKRRERDGPHG